jgi:predicted DNA-binding helix-hairpin-helix protein
MQVQVSLKIEISATAGLSQMEQQIQEAGQQAMREALKQAIKQQEEHNRRCPHCGQRQRRLQGTARRTIATTFGRGAAYRDGVFAVRPVCVGGVQPMTCSSNSKEQRSASPYRKRRGFQAVRGRIGWRVSC